jgi:hypothetical protein
MIVTVLLVILILMLIGALPQWPHAKEWGYTPVMVIVVVLLVVVLLGVR